MLLAIVFGILLLLTLLCGGLFIALLIPSVSSARNTARTMQVSNHLKQIAVAMHAYHAEYNQLPDPVIRDLEGKPLYSWRVALLPYLDEQIKWEQWQQDEPWDSPVNAERGANPPVVFVTPWEKNSGSQTKQNHVFTLRHARGTMPGNTVVTFGDIPDGLDKTILAVFLPGRGTPWAAPEDIQLDDLILEFQNLSASHPIEVLFADGSVEIFREPLDAATIEAMVTRDGGELASGD